MAKRQSKADMDFRNRMIVRYARRGASLSEIARMPAVGLSAGRIQEIIASHPDYESIVADRDKARKEQITDKAFNDYNAAQSEKAKRLAPDRIKKMTTPDLIRVEASAIDTMQKMSRKELMEHLIVTVIELQKQIAEIKGAKP